MLADLIEAIIRFFYNLFGGKNSNQKSSSKKKNIRVYEKRNFMTPSEISFYQKIRPLEISHNIRIAPQVNLATVIKKISNDRYQSELYRNIDFGIFNNDFTELILLIELNDSSHNTSKRKSRDIKVRNLTDQAGIGLMTFYTCYDNKIDYVQNRIINEINLYNNKNLNNQI